MSQSSRASRIVTPLFSVIVHSSPFPCPTSGKNTTVGSKLEGSPPPFFVCMKYKIKKQNKLTSRRDKENSFIITSDICCFSAVIHFSAQIRCIFINYWCRLHRHLSTSLHIKYFCHQVFFKAAFCASLTMIQLRICYGLIVLLTTILRTL